MKKLALFSFAFALIHIVSVKMLKNEMKDTDKMK